ncbi:unnamed protein product [Staurois parvus]|uniref:Uncharacterized protein n=1 Tax=Staurois parvus TaxID=386267 RepID=A0ABN9D894_9NEOB|nr:unnamed protein product [Staurois parvus]
MSVFKIFKFPAGSGPRMSRTSGARRDRNSEMARDAAGDTSRERRTR